MNSSVNTWDGDWKGRITLRVKQLGYLSYLDFLIARPGQSYDQMARELGNDVAPVQLEWLHANSTNDSDRIEAIIDSLARYLGGALRKGWALDKYWETSLIGAFANWYVMWNSRPELYAFQKEIYLMNPEPGWIPKDSADPILSEAAKRVWSRSQ